MWIDKNLVYQVGDQTKVSKDVIEITVTVYEPNATHKAIITIPLLLITKVWQYDIQSLPGSAVQVYSQQQALNERTAH